MARNAKKSEVKFIEKEVNECITVRMYPPQKDRANASLTLDVISGHLVIYGSAVKGRNGWFFSYPQYKSKDGEYKNLVFALEKEVNDGIAATLEECAKEF